MRATVPVARASAAARAPATRLARAHARLAGKVALRKVVTASPVAVKAVAADSTPKTKPVWTFGKGKGVGDKTMKTLLGGKGANLAEMCKIGLSVPPGMTITTEVCAEFHEVGGKLPDGVWEEVLEGLKEVEDEMGSKLGDSENPLLLSVRSGAAISMPGMMDTVLNLGLNDASVEGLAKKTGNERFAWDSYRRFIDMFGVVVLGIEHHHFSHELDALKASKGVSEDTELTVDDLKTLVSTYKGVYEKEGLVFPEDPMDQLRNAIYAVFDSWNSERANVYRAVQNIVGLKGTAVNVQAMAFGNMGDTSGTGVCFTRDPNTGAKYLYGEYLINAQGEDVVAGIRTPSPIEDLKNKLPEAYDELIRNCDILEQHYKDMQDIEFTIQDNKLYMLQCRSGKRTGAASLKIAMDLVAEGAIDIPKAVTMVEPGHLDQLLHPNFVNEEAYKSDVIAEGLPASPGAAVGQIVFSSEDAKEVKASGGKAILVRVETSPEDVGGMDAAEGVLTARGGMTSHAAVVARGWGKTCICGCGELNIDEENGTLTVKGVTLKQGDWVSLNGTTGEVILGKHAVAPPELSGDLAKFMGWVDQYRQMKVLTNADTPEDAATARKNGAEGIGLVRTEHMFFGAGARLKAVRRMIVAQDEETRRAALADILPFQRSDFEGIFEAMTGLPVTIRLLDPPLHEFLPDGENLDEIIAQMSKDTGVPEEVLEYTIEGMEELNPMLGFRGCRLAIAYPEIAEMQVRAIMEAALNAKAKGVDAQPDIMVPLVGTVAELKHQSDLIKRVSEEVFAERGERLDFRIGTMIEVPRAALLADEIAEHAEFFSYGTNDLTQMTFGYSRDDVSKFLPAYLKKGILKYDPFQVLDQEGVGSLIKMSASAGKAKRANLKAGVCGEQGGEPMSVAYCQSIGLDYVSCSPFRVPIARLASAQAAIEAAGLAK